MDSKHNRGYSDPDRDFLGTARYQHHTHWLHGWAKAMDCHRFGGRNRGNRAAGVYESLSGQRFLIKTKSLQSLSVPDNRDQGE